MRRLIPGWALLLATIPGSGDRYTGCSSLAGRRCVRGGTWTHDLAGARLALFAMGGAGGHVAEFDYVRVSRPAR